MTTTLERPTAAPFATRTLAQARFEAGVHLRNGEQLIVSVVLPLMAMVGLTLAPFPNLGPGPRIDVIAPGVLGLVVISTAFTGQAIQTGFDRRYGVLRYLGVTPLGRGGLLAGKSLAVLGVIALQVLVIGGVAVGMGWRPHLAMIPVAAISLALGAWCFVALALALAGSVRAEAVLALANLVWVVLLAVGGIVVPSHVLSGPWQVVIDALPSAALGEAMRQPLGAGTWPLAAWGILIIWGALSTLLAARTFRWRD